eukprot:CAMPEP_0194479088 /NCGR_PEP_ID=MMETSP0253-20130528/2322_1 /TAXON_ID=2966 /ORGANISM="Noctiluca scintillans" /LENGTH=365 /DNA_ID=CAMNT_0039318261 /DNA_START=72 /DNA_END=1169 /DNA_ORIENTATION=-
MTDIDHVTARIVAQRLCNLLLQFPSAAVQGVQWHLLEEKYKEVYGTTLDVKRGHHDPLAAATALLWDVLRLPGQVDPENPVVALEDEVALMKCPGRMGCWPALYQVMNDVLLTSGLVKPVKDEDNVHPMHSLPLSRLEPLLVRQWRENFDDTGAEYFGSEGESQKIRGLKEVLECVLEWRKQRVHWQQEAGRSPSAIDIVLEPEIELVEGDDEDAGDYTLRCVRHDIFMSQDAILECGLRRSLRERNAAEEAIASEEMSSARYMEMSEWQSQQSQSHQAEESDEQMQDVEEEDRKEPLPKHLVVPVPAPRAAVPVREKIAGWTVPVKVVPNPVGKTASAAVAQKRSDRGAIPSGIVARFRTQFEK